MDVVKYWRNGSHVCSLNWQVYDRGMQINDAMFVGGPGWALKPAKIAGFGQAMEGKLRLKAHIVGVSSCTCSRSIIA